MQQVGGPFIETDDPLPNHLDLCGVGSDYRIVEMADLPESCRLPHQTLDTATTVPEMPDLPEGGVVTPAPGTPIGSGTTYIDVRAPMHKRWQFSITVYTAEDAKNELIAYAANKRWELMQLGADWRGHKVSTDDTSQARMTSAIVATTIIPDWSTIWQFPIDGTSAPITKAELIEIAMAAQAYVNALFVAFEGIRVKIQAGEIAANDQVDAAFAAALAPSA
ncbi:DUF4376 domain-containing protein [Methylobacterium gnaphalii]|uniref:DUF4376 domain-containing protein n=1 Tax=Methylobacterium gnaphalii TaxID=1010610 RepID=UPI0014784D5D|nr:DUF4376 domain-containing protein [Methylobacterium gnaphalii]